MVGPFGIFADPNEARASLVNKTPANFWPREIYVRNVCPGIKLVLYPISTR